MSKLNSLLLGRFKAGKKEKMNQLVERSNAGQLSSFSGVFQISPMSEQEKDLLRKILETYTTDDTTLSYDLETLTTITSEVKAIHNQAIILHGERIKKVQTLLKKYKDGAFSAYLITVYGNRQTPYNFLLYYDLYSTVSKNLQEIMMKMPRQAIYSLSSRKIPQEKKEEFIVTYQGETKTELLKKLRDLFPLSIQDKRGGNPVKGAIQLLKQAVVATKNPLFSPSKEEKKEMKILLSQIGSHLT